MFYKIVALLCVPLFLTKLIYERSKFRSVVKVVTYKLIGAEIRNNVYMQGHVRLYGVKNIKINEGVFLGEGVKIISYDAKVTIGNNCLIASDCILITRNHNFSDLKIPIKKQGYTNKDILIEDDVWLGYRVVVLPGITIGKGAIVAANSVVTKNIEPNTIYGGNPARLIKYRGNHESISHM